jgi:putative transposase
LFGEIGVGARSSRPDMLSHPEMSLNGCGEIVVNCWRDLPNRYDNVELDYFVVMPNHFHGIIILNSESVGVGSPRPPGSFSPHESEIVGARSSRPRENEGRENRAPTLGKIVAYYKYQTTKQINAVRNTGFQKIWQRNYHEHIIRDEESLDSIMEYIVNNPMKWDGDEMNPLRNG